MDPRSFGVAQGVLCEAELRLYSDCQSHNPLLTEDDFAALCMNATPLFSQSFCFLFFGRPVERALGDEFGESNFRDFGCSSRRVVELGKLWQMVQ